MKKKYLLGLSILSLFALVSCNSINNSGNVVDPSNGSDYDYNNQITIEDPEDINVIETNSDFSFTTKDGTFTKTGSIYKITAAGTYTASGKLEGQILVEAGDNDEVVIELNGASISYDQDSPIKVVNADKVEISAKKDTGNTVTDNRSVKTIDVNGIGEGAISAKSDLKLKGSGTLVVVGNYNNGIHTTKDLTIQKLSLKVTGYNVSIKGKNSVTITSGNIQAYAKTGEGIKTEKNDLSSKNKQRGTIEIDGGTLFIDSLRDAVDASYNVVVDQLDAEVSTNITIKTGTNSSFYSKSSFKSQSEKGLKAVNEIIINNGTIIVGASDDAIHANYGSTISSGGKGLGNITINGGLIQIASGDDGLHADNTLTINDGKIVVTGAKEGYEANYVNINGGQSYIYGSDDGINCSKKSFSKCAFTMTGGYLDIAIKNGDTDGIDSNGDFTLSGGTIVTRGSPGKDSSKMSTGLDVDGTCSMTGGTLIAFNGLEKTPSTSNGVLYAGTSQTSSGGFPGGPSGGPGWRPAYGGQSSTTSSYTLEAGNYTLSGEGLNVSFTNDYIYGAFLVYSSSLVSNATYTLSRENTTVFSWTQSSNSVTIS